MVNLLSTMSVNKTNNIQKELTAKPKPEFTMFFYFYVDYLSVYNHCSEIMNLYLPVLIL